jgi:hypothetical protein
MLERNDARGFAMKNFPGKFLLLFATVMLVAMTTGCVFAKGDISIAKQPFEKIAVTESKDFDHDRYKSIIVLPPRDRSSQVSDSLLPPIPEITSSQADEFGPVQGERQFVVRPAGPREFEFAAGVIERKLMTRGYRLITPEVIAKLDDRKSLRYDSKVTSQVLLQPAEKALLVSSETSANALLIIEHLGIWASEISYVFDGDMWIPGIRPTGLEDEGPWASYYLLEVSMRLKLVDIETGQVLWMAAGANNSREMFPMDWSAVLAVRGDEVFTEKESFRLSDFNTYNHLYQQIESLLGRMLVEL